MNADSERTGAHRRPDDPDYKPEWHPHGVRDAFRALGRTLREYALLMRLHRPIGIWLLLWHGPLSTLAKERLAVLRNTTDGFAVARRDLELRGPGELLGTRQTGLMQLKVADLMRDADLLPRVQAAADVMLSSHADNIAPLKRRWIGQSIHYGKV